MLWWVLPLLNTILLLWFFLRVMPSESVRQIPDRERWDS